MFHKKPKPSIDTVWARIETHTGETFWTVRGKPYTYQVGGNYIDLRNTNRRIPKSNVEAALSVEDPAPGKLQKMNLQGPSYLCGIITDKRIIEDVD